MVTIYRLDKTQQPPAFGKPDIAELVGETCIQSLNDVPISWDALVQRLVGSADGIQTPEQ